MPFYTHEWNTKKAMSERGFYPVKSMPLPRTSMYSSTEDDALKTMTPGEH